MNTCTTRVVMSERWVHVMCCTGTHAFT